MAARINRYIERFLLTDEERAQCLAYRYIYQKQDYILDIGQQVISEYQEALEEVQSKLDEANLKLAKANKTIINNNIKINSYKNKLKDARKNVDELKDKLVERTNIQTDVQTNIQSVISPQFDYIINAIDEMKNQISDVSTVISSATNDIAPYDSVSNIGISVQPVSQPIAQPVPQPVTQPVPQPVAQPIVQPVRTSPIRKSPTSKTSKSNGLYGDNKTIPKSLDELGLTQNQFEEIAKGIMNLIEWTGDPQDYFKAVDIQDDVTQIANNLKVVIATKNKRMPVTVIGDILRHMKITVMGGKNANCIPGYIVR